MTTTATGTPPFYRRGNYRPVTEELSATELPVTGAIPPELSGWYLRNGPNPRGSSAHWFTGEGMIHGVRLERGRAAWYRNHWVRTRSFTGGGNLYRPDGSRDLTVAAANTHVVNHAGRTLALVESSLPYEIDCEPNTLGPYDFGGRLADSMTAHPKICPRTGELHFFGYGSLTAPYVTYHRADAAGKLVLDRPIEVPRAHDEPGRIVLHVLRYPYLWRRNGEDSTASLWRWTIDLRSGTVTETRLDDRPCEFPRIDDRLAGAQARFAHVTDAGSGAIVRYDLMTQAEQSHVFGPGRTPAEAVFVPADDVPGGAGWLLTYVYDAVADSSDLVILDTADLSGPEVARIRLPARVPYGFHGNWIPEGAQPDPASQSVAFSANAASSPAGSFQPL